MLRIGCPKISKKVFANSLHKPYNKFKTNSHKGVGNMTTDKPAMQIEYLLRSNKQPSITEG